MPLQGVLDVGPLAERAPAMPGLSTESMEMAGAEILQLMFEIDAAAMVELLPPALHPTIPPTVTFVFYRVSESPIGRFTLAQARIGCRAGVRPRGYLLGAYIDNRESGDALTARWGYNCHIGRVTLRREYDRIVGTVATGGALILEAALADPEPISGGDVQYAANMNLARVDQDHEPKLRLVQVDPEFVFHKADRGRPVLNEFDAEAWGDARVGIVHPVSAVWTLCDLTMPRIRYICDPLVPATRGTEKVG